MEGSAPIAAATVILLRQGAPGLQVYLVQRRGGSGFMAGNHVFPGGVVDPGDRDAARWAEAADLAPTVVDDRLGGGLPWEEALAYGVAAIRETFEEAGTFFGDLGGAGGLGTLCDRRRDGPLPDGWLAAAVSAPGSRLAVSALARWAWWVTPPGMKRRFDTRFFVAAAPAGQRCSPDGREVVAGDWFAPEEALARNLAGELALSPPTLVTLHDLLGRDDARAVLADAAARPWGAPLGPRFVRTDRGALILEPWDPEHGSAGPLTLPGRLEDAVVPLGEPFSRLWHDGRIWRPVRAG